MCPAAPVESVSGGTEAFPEFVSGGFGKAWAVFLVSFPLLKQLIHGLSRIFPADFLGIGRGQGFDLVHDAFAVSDGVFDGFLSLHRLGLGQLIDSGQECGDASAKCLVIAHSGGGLQFRLEFREAAL